MRIIGSGARLTELPLGGELLAQLIAGQPETHGSQGSPPLAVT